MRWHELTVYGTDSSVSVDVDHGAIQTVATTIGSALHDADVDRYAVIARCFADRVEVAVFDTDSLAHVMCEEGLLQVGFEFRSLGSLDPEGVARHEGFTKRHNIAAFSRRIVDPGNDLADRRFSFQPHGGCLREADLELCVSHAVLQIAESKRRS